MKTVKPPFIRLVLLTVALLVAQFSIAGEQYQGPDDAVLLQGFHWQSHNYAWYTILYENAHRIRAAGFDFVWFPPPTETADSHGYLPTQWYDLTTRYGTEAELKKAIGALKTGNDAETGTTNVRPVYAIADLVLNHRCGHYNWADFADPHFAAEDETDPNRIRDANYAAVCSNDEWKDNRGSPGPNADTGDAFNGGRDIDHSNLHVQREITQWLQWLKSNVGFAGWRWDLVKGYHPRYVGMYNDASAPAISIGEYWDENRQNVVDWINRTTGKPDDAWGTPDRSGGKSAAFDFPTRDLVRKAVQSSDYRCLKTIDGKPAGMIGWWPAMSITFIENHDTETAHRPELAFPPDRIMEGYAYILTHPGKPCVFWKHFFEWGQSSRDSIKRLIALRKEMGINAKSSVNIHVAAKGLYAATIDEKLAMKIGHKDWMPQGSNWQLADHGKNFAVWQKTP